MKEKQHTLIHYLASQEKTSSQSVMRDVSREALRELKLVRTFCWEEGRMVNLPVEFFQLPVSSWSA